MERQPPVTFEFLVYKKLACRNAGAANGVRGGHVAFFPSGGGAALLTNAIARPLAPEVLGAHQAFSLPSLVEFFLVELHRGDLRTGGATRQQKFVRTIYKIRSTPKIGQDAADQRLREGSTSARHGGIARILPLG